MGTKTILIVDDSKTCLTRLRGILGEEEQYALVEAENGEDALAYARAHPAVDLILLDVQMPGIDGIEVCRTLKNGPETGHIPIVLVSGVHRDDYSIAAGLAAGADGYLTKPLEDTALLAWVRTTLRLSALQRSLAETPITPPENQIEILTEFARLSHAVNNPLQSVMTMADLLALDLDDQPRMLESLREIQTSAEKISTLVAGASRLAKECLSATQDTTERAG